MRAVVCGCLVVVWAGLDALAASERVVGWYSSGPKIRPNDIDINELFRKYTTDPLLCVIEATSTELGLPTKSYVSVEKVNADGTTAMTFKHVESQIGAVEAEEVGVEHLLRDIHDTSVSTLAQRVQDKTLALRSLVERLREIEAYLGHVVARHLPPNQALLDMLQSVFNLLPNLATADMADAFASKTNDSMLAIYLSSLVRSIVALHELINNRIANRDFEKKTFGFTQNGGPHATAPVVDAAGAPPPTAEAKE